MRGFAPSEFAARTAKAQALMAREGLAAILLTTEPDVRYFTGFLTRFWESPTRPWFVVVPATGKPIAVIPSIGAALMAQTWVEDIRTWSAPDPADDGVSLLADTLREIAPDGPIGMPDGHETHARMPQQDLHRLAQKVTLVSDAGLMRRLRMVKSQAEIAKVARACEIAGRAFARVPEIAQSGAPLDAVFRDFQILCLQEGADWVPYLAGGAGQGGYRDVISPASERALADGDVLMLDTGLVWDGYFADFDRNWSIGLPRAEVSAAHARLVAATDAACDIARPGATAADLYHVMHEILAQGTETPDTGRLGHGLGMSLTEWPSLIPSDHTVLEPGMILTLEPGIATGRGMIVHEENIVITDQAPVFLSPRIGPEVPIL